MAHKKKHTGPVPRGNKSNFGPTGNRDSEQEPDEQQDDASRQHEQDAKRRLGNFEGAGEQSFQQPGGKYDANH